MVFSAKVFCAVVAASAGGADAMEYFRAAQKKRESGNSGNQQNVPVTNHEKVRESGNPKPKQVTPPNSHGGAKNVAAKVTNQRKAQKSGNPKNAAARGWEGFQKERTFKKSFHEQRSKNKYLENPIGQNNANLKKEVQQTQEEPGDLMQQPQQQQDELEQMQQMQQVQQMQQEVQQMQQKQEQEELEDPTTKIYEINKEIQDLDRQYMSANRNEKIKLKEQKANLEEQKAKLEDNVKQKKKDDKVGTEKNKEKKTCAWYWKMLFMC